MRPRVGDPDGISSPGDARVVADAPADYRGLELPGFRAARHPWHSRLEVVLLEDELRIAGSGLLARFPMSAMVLASYCSDQSGALRIDLLDGTHLCVRLRDQGQLMVCLRHQIWEYEQSLVGDASDVDWALIVSPATVAEAEVAMDAADARLQASGSTLAEDPVARHLVTRSIELHHEARVDALRLRRKRMLSRSLA